MPVGKLEPFEVDADDWTLYIERVEQYFIVNDIKVELKVPTLITVMGSASYELLVTLCTPKKPSTLTFEEIVKIMQGHLQPTPNVLAERYKFRQRKQAKGESIASYAAELKKMTKFCNFEKELDNNIRDQFVCGLDSDVIRQRLFTGEVLSFTKAFQLAVAMEAAEADSAMLDHRAREQDADGRGSGFNRDSTAQVVQAHHIGADRRSNGRSAMGQGARVASKQQRNRFTKMAGNRTDSRNAVAQAKVSRCLACGASHDVLSCRFRRYTCRVCNQEGHLKKMCPRIRSDTKWLQTQEEEEVDIEEDYDDNLEQIC